MFIRECKAISKSIIYFAFVAVTVLFYATQFGNTAGDDIRQFKTFEKGEQLPNIALIAPAPGQESYGQRSAEIPEQVMPNATKRLLGEYADNSFTSYPIGFYRNIRLDEKQLKEIETILTKMTGLPVDELQTSSGSVPFIVSYEEFKAYMRHIDKMIGGGSYYEESNLKQFGSIAVSYDEKLAEYNALLNEDKITGAYARYFCDYMGITLALFSVFVPVSFLLRDRRANMSELVYSRAKSSTSIVLNRYFALAFMTIAPFMLLSLIPDLQLSVFGAQNGINVDNFAFLKYIAAWLLPTGLFANAVAYCLTTLTDTPIAIVLQAVWGIFGMLSSAKYLEGGRYGIELAIRHNSIGNLHLVKESMGALILNRLSYTAISLFLIVVSIFLFDLKRRGRLNAYSFFKKAPQNR